MKIRGDAHRYGQLAITLHWASGLAVFVLLALGLAAANTADPARAATLLRVHVPLGVLVLGLTLMRIVWRFFDVRPGDPSGQPRWQALITHVTHVLLYAILVLIGFSGIGVMVLSDAAPILFFGSNAALPHFFDFAPMKAHAFSAFALMGLLCLHIGAALYHQSYRRDGLLARMDIDASR
ncbi:cytochrome b [uncultured Sphingomonas sp.]|uniref:cytochrome b n=1 Tax=uncultured Sphingomonas sp. TaxID=158754 RepID=UPI0035C9AFCB